MAYEKYIDIPIIKGSSTYLYKDGRDDFGDILQVNNEVIRYYFQEFIIKSSVLKTLEECWKDDLIFDDLFFYRSVCDFLDAKSIGAMKIKIISHSPVIAGHIKDDPHIKIRFSCYVKGNRQ